MESLEELKRKYAREVSFREVEADNDARNAKRRALKAKVRSMEFQRKHPRLSKFGGMIGTATKATARTINNVAEANRKAEAKARKANKGKPQRRSQRVNLYGEPI